jgi:hypothetical protein
LSDECSSLLSFLVIGVVITSAKDVRSEEDASLDFATKAGIASLSVESLEVAIGPFHAQTKAYTVEASEIAGCLGRSHDVVRGHPVRCVRQAYVFYRAPELLQGFYGFENSLPHFWIEPLTKVLFRYAQSQTGNVTIAGGHEVRNWCA